MALRGSVGVEGCMLVDNQACNFTALFASVGFFKKAWGDAQAQVDYRGMSGTPFCRQCHVLEIRVISLELAVALMLDNK